MNKKAGQKRSPVSWLMELAAPRRWEYLFSVLTVSYTHLIKAAFLVAFNTVLNDKAEIMAAYGEVMEALTDTSDFDSEREQLQSEADVVMELIRKCISENAHKAQDQEDVYKRQDQECVCKYEYHHSKCISGE